MVVISHLLGEGGIALSDGFPHGEERVISVRWRVVTACLLGAISCVFLLSGSGATAATQVATASACTTAADLLEQGELNDARAVAAAVGGECEESINQAADARSAASDKLVDRADATKDESDKKHLADLALELNADSGTAAAIIEGLPAKEDDSLCQGADDAREAGEYARAEALYKSLEDTDDAKACRIEGLVALEKARQGEWPIRLSNFVTSDALPLGLVLLVAFTAGVVLAGLWRKDMRRWWFLLAVVPSLLLAICYLNVSTPEHTEASMEVGLLLATAVLVFVAGFLMSSAARTRSPMSLEVGEDKSLAGLVVAEIENLGRARSSGVRIQANSDVSDNTISAALAGSGRLAAVLKVWNAVRLRTGDRVEVSLVAEKDSIASATVSMYRGRRLDTVAAVNGLIYCQDRSKPSDEELANSKRDVTTGVGAAIVLWKLQAADEKGVPRDVLKVKRLYGATVPIGVGLVAVANRRLAAGNAMASSILLSRAIDADAKNRSAQVGFLDAVMTVYPGSTELQRRVKEFEALFVNECGLPLAEKTYQALESPLRWRLRYNLAAWKANELMGELVAAGPVTRESLQGAAIGFQQVAGFLEGFFAPKSVTHAAIPWRDHEVTLPEQGGTVQTVPSGLGMVIDSDAPLWQRISDLASLTQRLLLMTRPNRSDQQLKEDVKALRDFGLGAPREQQFAVACGLAVAYTLGLHDGLADEAAHRIRIWGEGASSGRRSRALDDPFLMLLKSTEPFKKLADDWKVAVTTPYDGVDCFGKLTAELAEMFASPARMATELADPVQRASLALALKIDRTALPAWQGAATWLSWSRPPELINLYQRSGFTGPVSVAATRDAVVAERIAATAVLTGVPVPTPEQQREMKPGRAAPPPDDVAESEVKTESS
jgi:hypothetical protein